MKLEIDETGERAYFDRLKHIISGYGSVQEYDIIIPFRFKLSCSFLYGDKVIILFFTQYFILNFSSYTPPFCYRISLSVSL